MELVNKLRKRERENNPIRVGIVGCGQMGSGLAHAVNNVTGMTIAAIADIDPARGIKTFVEMGHDKESVVITDDAGTAQDTVIGGKPVVTSNALLMTAIPGLEANVEATGGTNIGARVAYESILNGKPIKMDS